jgi:hypothetical protein
LLASLVGLAALLLAAYLLVTVGDRAPFGRAAAFSEQERDALTFGRQSALNVFSFDYRKINDQLAVINREAGGKFAEQFASSKAALIKVVTDEQRVSSARVVQVGLVDSSRNDVRMVVALNEFRVTKAVPKGTPYLQRMELSLHHDSHGWKLVDLRPVT